MIGFQLLTHTQTDHSSPSVVPFLRTAILSVARSNDLQTVDWTAYHTRVDFRN